MSLLHNPIYDDKYTFEDDVQGLKKLRWSQFMCKCGICDVGSGRRLMERLPVFILDEIAQEERIRLDIELGYTCKKHSDDLVLTSQDPHRVGLAVRIRTLNPKKRMLMLRGLIVRGVTRIGVNEKFIYFDVDDLLSMGLFFK